MFTKQLFESVSKAAVMKPAFENLLGEAERENYSNVARWYQTVSSQDSLKKLFKVNFISSRKEFNAADLKVTRN